MKYKVSANIVAKNERYWIKESILSIVEYVNEIIFVDDDSTDGTLEIVTELSKLYNNIKIFKASEEKLYDLGQLKNFAKEKSKNNFVIRWDADFIAYKEIEELFIFLENNLDKYDGYVLIGPNLQGDINHYLNGKENYGPEVNLFRKDKMRFGITERYNDYPIFQKETRYCYPLNTTLKRNHFFVHMNKLKSLKSIAYRKRMEEYHNKKSKNQSYWKWLGYDSDEVGIKAEIDKVKNENFDLCKFNYEKWGKHPDILLNSKSTNLFNIRNDDGKIYLDYKV